MNLTPESAKRLADALLDSNPGEPRDESIPVGRLSPGSFGRYRITRLVGVGGMGEVYEAEQQSPARKVAIKVVRPDLLSGDVLRRFEHETRILGRLQHPGIAPIYEAGQVQTAAGSTPFFAMEYVDGKPLTGYAHEGKLPLRERLELFLKVCDAVEHAHRKGVIHRDLKPGNILVGADGRPRVMDFGVARATDSDVRATTMHTELGRLVGTLPYMSPEQVGGDPDALDTRSDVYSLGVVLYELLGEKLPYELKGDGRGRIPEAVRAIQESEPAPLSSVDKVFRGDLDTIVAKALAKERGQRYQSVGELAADIRRYLADEPIVARRPSAWYQVRKFARRNRLLVGVLGGSVLGLGAAATVAVVMAVRATAEQRLADKRQTESALRAKYSTEMVNFLQRVFSAPHPTKSGVDVKVVDLLQNARGALASEFADQPDVEGAVGTAIGLAYLGLGQYGEAEACLSEAKARWEAAGQGQSPDALQTIGYLAQALANEGKYDEAEPLMVQGAELSEKVLGSNHPDTLSALNDLATLRHTQGKLDEAERTFRTVLERRPSVQQEPRERYIVADNLATVLVDETKFSEARDLFEQNIAGMMRDLGPDDPTLLGSMNNYAAMLIKMREFEKAEGLARKSYEGRKQVLGPEHPQTVTSAQTLAACLRALKRLDEAQALLQWVYDLRVRQFGAQSDPALMTEHTLALVQNDRGNVAEAERMLKEVLEGRRKLFGENHPSTLNAVQTLGDLYRMRGRFAEAADAYDEAVKIGVVVLGPKDWQYGRLLCMRGEMLAKSGHLQEACALIREGAPLVEASRQYRIATHLCEVAAGIFEEAGDSDEAERYRAKSKALQAKYEHPDPP